MKIKSVLLVGAIICLAASPAFAQQQARAQAAPQQVQQVPNKACGNMTLLDVDTATGTFKVPNSQVNWRDPVPAKAGANAGEWIMPDDKVVKAPVGYKVEVALATDCALRYTTASLAPDNVSGSDSANVKGWPKRK